MDLGARQELVRRLKTFERGLELAPLEQLGALHELFLRRSLGIARARGRGLGDPRRQRPDAGAAPGHQGGGHRPHTQPASPPPAAPVPSPSSPWQKSPVAETGGASPSAALLV